jgi:uncharacterized membrane protein
MTNSFASGLNFYKQFWIFFIGCFLGVIIETVWCRFRFKKFESRKGLIYGPFNLVYGFGALVMTLFTALLGEINDLGIILCGAFIGGVYEYICSAFQERAFGSVSWNYKNFPLNINGRINLIYCFFWGILALLWVRGLYPALSCLIELIPDKHGIPLTWFCLVFMVFDSIISACAVYRMSQRLNNVKAASRFWEFIDRHYPDERIRKIYPNMEFNNISFGGATLNEKFS